MERCEQRYTFSAKKFFGYLSVQRHWKQNALSKAKLPASLLIKIRARKIFPKETNRVSDFSQKSVLKKTFTSKRAIVNC